MEILNDFSTSVTKALDEIDPKWKDYTGLIIAGSWPGENDEKVVTDCLGKLKEAEEKGIPVLGICLGMQVIGISRGWKLSKLKERHVGIYEVNGWWGKTYETFWHDYEVRKYWQDGILDGFYSVNHHKEKNIIGVQFHPEYQSSKDKPHPILVEFLNLCREYQLSFPL